MKRPQPLLQSVGFSTLSTAAVVSRASPPEYRGPIRRRKRGYILTMDQSVRFQVRADVVHGERPGREDRDGGQ
eukprot:9268012-Pyramimonas_sp.AAC.1